MFRLDSADQYILSWIVILSILALLSGLGIWGLWAWLS